MTDHIENGGTAFPYSGKGPIAMRAGMTVMGDVHYQGMSLRDWFAGKALAGLIPAYTAAYGSPTSNVPEIVTEAYIFADAMLEARSAKK